MENSKQLKIGTIVGARMYLGRRDMFDDHYVKGGAWRSEEVREDTCRCSCGYVNCISGWETDFWVCPMCGTPQ